MLCGALLWLTCSVNKRIISSIPTRITKIWKAGFGCQRIAWLLRRRLLTSVPARKQHSVGAKERASDSRCLRSRRGHLFCPKMRKQMPFMLYDTRSVPNGKEYALVRQVKLAGRNGPLATISRSKNSQVEIPFHWHATGSEIVAQLGGTSQQAVIIDLKPKVAGNVSLYKLLDVWGFSYEDWTPIALILESLFVDKDVRDPGTFKTRFVHECREDSLVGEFLYLQGGVKHSAHRNEWNWGQVGSVNGALLWPDAFRFLAGEIAIALNCSTVVSRTGS
jgi:hypothetical protein